MYTITMIMGKRPPRKVYYAGQRPQNPRSKRQSGPSTIWITDERQAVLFPTEKAAKETAAALYGGTVEHLDSASARGLAVWEAVNAYAAACGDTGSGTASIARQKAAAAVSSAVGL